MLRLPIDDFTRAVGSFDTLMLLGNNFVIFGSPHRLRVFLTEGSHKTHEGTRILAESTNPI